MKKNKNIPKYKNGGGQNAWDFTKNLGLTIADTALSGLGAENAIGEEDYQGKSANNFRKVSNTAGSITKSIVPIAGAVGGAAIGTAMGNPMLGAKMGYGLAKGVQGIGSSVSPADETGGSDAYMQSQRTGNKLEQGFDQFGAMAVPAAGILTPMLMNQGQVPMGPTAGMYAMGGMAGQPNAEVEGGENSIAPNGEFTQYNGPSHEQGGIPTQLENKEIVFSDRLKPKGSKKTFAELNKPFNTNKEDKITEDKKANNLKKLTADLMKQAKIKQSVALYQEQEALKQSKLDNYAKRLGVSGESYKYGGQKNLPKYWNGKNAWETPNNDMLAGKPQENNIMMGAMPGSTYTPSANKNLMFDYSNPAENEAYWNSQSSTEPELFNPQRGQSRQGSNAGKYAALGQLAMGIAQNAGNLYDLKRSKTVDSEVYNTYNPTLLNPSEALKYNNMQGKMAANNIREASGGNASTYLNNRKDLSINQMMLNNRIKQDYENINAQIKNQAGYYNTGVADKNMLAKLQNEGAAKNMKSAAIHNIGYNTTNQYQNYLVDKNKQGRDEDYLKIILAKYPEIGKDPELAKMFQLK